MTEHSFKASKKPECPEGYIVRKAYTTKTGKLVPTRCIKKTGIFSGKAETKAKEIRKQTKEEQKKALKKAKEMCAKEGCKIPTECPPGKIMRNAYERKSYTRNNGTKVKGSVVPPSCIEDKGKKGKGKKVIILNPNDHILSDHGYENVVDLQENKRHNILKKIIKDVGKKEGEKKGYLYTIRALRARANLLKKTEPKISKIFSDDQKWVSSLYDKMKSKK